MLHRMSIIVKSKYHEFYIIGNYSCVLVLLYDILMERIYREQEVKRERLS